MEPTGQFGYFVKQEFNNILWYDNWEIKFLCILIYRDTEFVVLK